MARWDVVLFDLDGTLTDPKEGITRSIAYALGKMGVEAGDPDGLTRFIGPPLARSFAECYGFDGARVAEAVGWYRERFVERGLYENAVYAGVPELLAALRDAGRRVALATSKPTVYARQILGHFDLEGCFDAVIGSNLDGTRADKAEVIACAMEAFPGLPATDFVMVGDRRHDMEGAARCGIACVGVTYGYGSCEELAACGPAALVDTVGDLRALLLAG